MLNIMRVLDGKCESNVGDRTLRFTNDNSADAGETGLCPLLHMEQGGIGFEDNARVNVCGA